MKIGLPLRDGLPHVYSCGVLGGTSPRGSFDPRNEQLVNWDAFPLFWGTTEVGVPCLNFGGFTLW